MFSWSKKADRLATDARDGGKYYVGLGHGSAAYLAHAFDAEGVNPLRTAFGFLAFMGVFTLFPLFPLFFDSAGWLFACKNWAVVKVQDLMCVKIIAHLFYKARENVAFTPPLQRGIKGGGSDSPSNSLTSQCSLGFILVQYQGQGNS